MVNAHAKCPIPQPYCPNVDGDISQTGDYVLVGDFTQTGDLFVTGTIDFSLLANDGSFNRANMLADLVRVNEGTGITKGKAVYINGVTGDKPQVGLTDNTVHAKSHVFGIALDTGADGELIRVMVFGEARDLATDGYASTGLLHLTTAGNMTRAIPTSGAHIHTGWVTKQNANDGIIEVTADQYMHDMRATTDVDLELATGSDTTARKISYQNYSATEIGYMDGAGNFVWGTAANYSNIEPDGTLEFNGTATVFEDLSLSLDSARVPAANDPNWETFVGNLNAYAYQVNDFQEFTQELLHGYKEGSTFQFHIHGALNATLAAGNETVKFEIEYSIADMDATDGLGDVFPATTTINAEFTVPDTTADLTQLFLIIGTDTTAAFQVGATVKGRVRRIASSGSELVGNIFLTQVGIHYEIDTVGSRSINTKN